MAMRMHSKETMIDTRPGTSTVGVQCSIWEKPPEQRLPCSMGQDASVPLNKVIEVRSPQESCETDNQNDQLVSQNLNLDHGREDVTVESESTRQGDSSSLQHEIPAIDDVSYSLMVEVLSGCFNIPVKERTKHHKSIIVQLWKNKGKFTVSDSHPANLYYNGKRVPRKSQLRKLTSHGSEGKNPGRVRPSKRTLGEEFVALAERNNFEDLRKDQRESSMQSFCFRSNTSENSNHGRNDDVQASPSKQHKESSPQNDLNELPALDEESYSLMVDVLKGQFKTPIRKRTKRQKAALILLWRNKGRYTVDDCNPTNLYYDGKCVQRNPTGLTACDS